MYTQCPECNAVYRVASAHLRVAAGEVQCGACGARFDALDRLSDTYPRAPADSLGEAPESTGESSVASAGSQEADAGTELGEETDETEVTGAAPAEDESPRDDRGEPHIEAAGDSEGEEESSAAEHDEPTEPALAEADATGALNDTAEAHEAPPEKITAVADDEEPTVDVDVSAGELFAVAELRDQELPEVDQLEFVEGLPSGQLEDAGTAHQAPPGEMLSQHPSAVLRWRRKLILPALLLGLAALVIHSQRGTLMRQPALAPVLGGIYGIMGINVEPAWQVAAYRIVDSAAEIDSGGDLQVMVTFVNEAPFPQPYPVLRVSLEDRWGDEIGSREIDPRAYIAGFADGRMMPPGEAVEGRATVAAPPTAAVGFRLDLCLARGGNQLDCMSNQP